MAETPSPIETTPFAEDRLMLDALDGAYELPSCPVCLERLDASISGLGQSFPPELVNRLQTRLTDSCS